MNQQTNNRNNNRGNNNQNYNKSPPDCFYDNHPSQQQQKQVPIQQNQLIAEIRYTVYQDLQNLINLLYSMSEVTRAFKNAPDNTMVTISRNKIIFQLNLSNTIHRDLEQRSSQIELASYELNKVKEKASKIASNAKIDPNFNGYLNQYIQNNLCKNVKETVLPLDKVDVKGNFNENVLQQIISSIQITDQQYEKIRQNPQQIIDPTPDEVIKKAEQYKQLTAQKIAKNFPQLKR